VVTTDLTTRARAGDGDAFRELTEPHRRELQAHCCRMLGSFQDAEETLRDTLLFFSAMIFIFQRVVIRP